MEFRFSASKPPTYASVETAMTHADRGVDHSMPRSGGQPIVRAAVVVTFFNTWVLFEETVVDRYGLWQYMPYYRVARLCAWDIGALALIMWLCAKPFRAVRPAALKTAPGSE